MHLVYAIDRLTSGGAQRQVVELGLRLSATPGVRVSVLSYPSPNFFAQRLEDAGVPVVQLPKSGPFDARFPLRLRDWLDRNEADVVHAFILGPILFGYLACRSLPADRRPAFVPAERNVLSGATRTSLAIKRWIYPRSEVVTVNSHLAADEVATRFRVPRERLRVLPNGIDVAQWDLDAEAEPPFELESDRFHLAVVGRFAPQKNHRLVLEALTLLGPEARDLRVWFVGDDRVHSDLARWIAREIDERDLGDVVRIVPPTPAIAPLISRLDGLLLPSGREGFPNVLLEAMTLGTPAIAARAGEVPHMLEHERTGLLLDRTTPEELAQAIRQLRSLSAGERDELAKAARATVEAKYSIDRVAEAHLDLYRTLARRRSGD